MEINIFPSAICTQINVAVMYISVCFLPNGYAVTTVSSVKISCVYSTVPSLSNLHDALGKCLAESSNVPSRSYIGEAIQLSTYCQE